MNFTFGGDPEFMIMSPDGDMVSAIAHIPGTKSHQDPLGKHYVHHDNVMAECAVAYGQTRQESLDNIQDCLQRLARLIEPNRIVCRAAHYYEPKELKSPESLEAFCLPEFCAYTLKPKKGDRVAFRRNTLRTAGGHVHLGTELARVQYGSVMFARMMDLFVGIPSVLIDHDRTECLRKALYGKAGRYRQPPHGIEYRSMGNFWLSSPKLVGLIYDLCEFVVDFVGSGFHNDLWVIEHDKLRDDNIKNHPRFNAAKFHHCIGYDADRLRLAIDNVDRDLAWEFLEFNKKYFPPKLYKRIVALSSPAQYDPYEEWDLN